MKLEPLQWVFCGGRVEIREGLLQVFEGSPKPQGSGGKGRVRLGCANLLSGFVFSAFKWNRFTLLGHSFGESVKGRTQVLGRAVGERKLDTVVPGTFPCPSEERGKRIF